LAKNQKIPRLFFSFTPRISQKKSITFYAHTAHNSNVCYSIFIPRCRCAEDFFEEIFEGFRENRRSRASCRSA